MPTEIASACARCDLVAFYLAPQEARLRGVDKTLPVIGFDAQGKALVVTAAGSVVRATQARVYHDGERYLFSRVGRDALWT